MGKRKPSKCAHKEYLDAEVDLGLHKEYDLFLLFFIVLSRSYELIPLPVRLVYRVQIKRLNTIYLTSITQKAQRTYRRVLEGADVGVLWSYVVEETEEPWKNHQHLDGRPLPCHMPTPGFDPGLQR